MEENNGDMSRNEADIMLALWADCMELDTDSTIFKNLQEELNYVVRKKKLGFDSESEVFTLKLIKPIEDIETIELKECTFKDKKSLTRQKTSDYEVAVMTITKYSDLTFQQVEQLKDRDFNRINAVVLGFLSHTPQLRD